MDNLRIVTLNEFTASKDFTDLLSSLLTEIEKSVKLESKLYGDGFVSRGLPNLVIGVDRKSTRVYKRVIHDATGRDSFDHDLGDLVRYAIYLQLFYRMCVKEGKLPKPVVDDVILQEVYKEYPELESWRK